MLKNLFCSAIAMTMVVACGGSQSRTSPPQQEPDPAPTGAAPSGSDASVKAATAAAESWLALVDDEKYPDSWSAAAKPFQAAVSQENWASSMRRVRVPLGKLVSRQFQSGEYRTSLPGAPDGKYVVLRFNTAFDKKAHGVETVTPMQEADGTWKVSGYFIK